MKRIKIILICFCLTILSGGCSDREDEQIKSGYRIYYVNSEENDIVTESYRASSRKTEKMIDEFLKKLDDSGNSADYKAARPQEVKLEEYNLKDGTLSLKFSPEYDKMQNTTEILMRMAYVKTLIQIPGVDFVDFYVDELPLQDSNGNAVGAMSEDTFIDNSGGQINEYEEADIILYFASEKGNALKQTMKSIVYDQNIPLEKVVIEQLIKGPSAGRGLYPTLPENTKLISVNVKDSICYVNFSEEFLQPANGVSEEVQIYSVVNSLAELATVSKVQIAINGVTDKTFVEKMDFNTVFERNLDIIEKQGEDDMVD